MPNSLITQRLQAQMQDARFGMSQLETELSTGQKFQIPSEDPIDASHAIQLQSLLTQNTQLDSNVQASTSLLNATDSALASISGALNAAKGLDSSGVGNANTPEQKVSMAQEVQALIQEVVNTGNSTFGGRYLFGGSRNTTGPFSVTSTGAVLYSGDQQSLNNLVDVGLTQATNVDGNTALAALTPPVTSDINPALTLQTQLSALKAGQGVATGQISVTLSSPATTTTIDLSQAKTIGDVKNIIENALGAANVTVGINAAKNGISITPTAGTITIADPPGGSVASNLGIAGNALASINSGDLNPDLTLTTKLADLNGGAGIGATAGNGLLITNGSTQKVVDISSAVTVEDLLNLLKSPDLNLSVGINSAGNGLAISSRLSGADFSIGENNGQNATKLGIRTFTGSTLLSSLNYGQGIPVNGGQPLAITRRDGTVVNVDLSGSISVQDVINKINAVDPGNLVASLNAVGNGLSLVDNSGAGPLSVDTSALGTALGLAGTEPGNNPAVPLVGKDVNAQETGGTLDILVRLQKALETNDNATLTRLGGMIDDESTRVTGVRAALGARMQTLQNVDASLKNQNLQTQQALSNSKDADMATVLSELIARQTAFEATLRAAAQTMQLSLAQFL
ncbi:MAG TPA: flagellar hook-associated protein FlgL [Planctomycetaceae bacterium]|nr:flagellar hook-associated protein FlgL [Planctomycetaceae bacterium]